mmetsp:Transcript_15896/g.36188  ORF Transcript_15896/g.36188 Transcript_15896/m.36188 type:complete len:906 (-) Transcript_15896:167-2884(-)
MSTFLSPKRMLEHVRTSRASIFPESMGVRKEGSSKVSRTAEKMFDSFKTTIVDSEGEQLTLTMRISSKTQHTVSWDEPIKLPGGSTETLDPGVCNLYQYPKVQFIRRGQSGIPGLPALEPPRVLAGPLLETLHRALTSMFLDGRHDCMERVDGAGARPIHAILLANTAAAVELATALLSARPRLMLQSHVGQPFEGENVLHVLIVNRQEEIVCQMVELAFKLFEVDELQSLFWGQTTGVFFQEEPMLLYGGTLAGYATAFSLERAITTMLVCSSAWRRRMRRLGKEALSRIDFIDPNSENCACQTTGFLPLHVAVANGLASMYNFWVDLPSLSIEFDHLLARSQQRSLVRRLTYYSRLTPLQAAAKLGDHRMVQYIIRCQSIVNWIWGPVTELHLSLEGIDSLGVTNNDVMELVAVIGASHNTQSMLLESFMQGFIYSLFSQKWHNFGRHMHCIMRFFDLIYLVLLAWLILQMKQDPASTDLVMNPILVMISTIPIWEEDIRVTRLWWQLFRNSSGKDGWPDMSELKRLFVWMNSHQVLTRLFGFALVAPACFVLISSDYSEYSLVEIEQGQHFDVLWVPMAFALFFHVQNFSRTLLAPSERLGVLYISVFKMLASDVTDFVLLFVIFLMNYGLAMYISYPRAGSQTLEQVGSFNNPIDALNDLVTLAFTGDPIILNLDRAQLQSLTTTEYADFIFFVIFYLIYVIMSMILLLNLLIAMMGDTFANTMRASTLEWRVDFARRLLRLELQSRGLVKFFGLQLNAGTKINDGWYHVYRKYEANEEGGGRGKGGSMFAADVEAEAEADALDDTKVVGTSDETAPSLHLQDSSSCSIAPADRRKWSVGSGREADRPEPVRRPPHESQRKLHRAATRMHVKPGSSKSVYSMAEVRNDSLPPNETSDHDND